VSARYRQLAAHVRRLADDDLNDLLVDLPTDRFTALVEAALSHPVSPAGLGCGWSRRPRPKAGRY
jgi:hypothetical protein